MEEKHDWNPKVYLKYGDERTRPSRDLIARINLKNPRRIIDIGCGPGNSTAALAARFPEARLTGLDNSPAMIEKSKADFPSTDWILADAGAYEPDGQFDLVYSSAAIQWLPDHERLMGRFLSWTRAGGAVAVQMPLFHHMPMNRAIARTAGKRRWAEALADCSNLFTYHDPEFYYDRLAPRASTLDLWVTTYFHVLDSQPALVEWIGATGLRPYLDRLPEAAEKKAFEVDFLDELKADYPVRPDGKVLFPFKRLFFIAYRAG